MADVAIRISKQDLKERIVTPVCASVHNDMGIDTLLRRF